MKRKTVKHQKEDNGKGRKKEKKNWKEWEKKKYRIFQIVLKPKLDSKTD